MASPSPSASVTEPASPVCTEVSVKMEPARISAPRLTAVEKVASSYGSDIPDLLLDDPIERTVGEGATVPPDQYDVVFGRLERLIDQPVPALLGGAESIRGVPSIGALESSYLKIATASTRQIDVMANCGGGKQKTMSISYGVRVEFAYVGCDVDLRRGEAASALHAKAKKSYC